MLRNEMPASQHQRKRRKVNKMIIIAAFLNFFYVNKITAAKSKSCNQNNIPVRANAWMCRNETQEKQYDSCYSGDEKQEAIDNPEIRFATPFYERDSQHDQEKGPTADKWRKETRVRSIFIGKPVYQCFG